ncbi:MAG: glycoside hydrolase family 38 C-terminal domain-containing protein [Phycisphaerae bacterium]|jgi:alpha-mannosidase
MLVEQKTLSKLEWLERQYEALRFQTVAQVDMEYTQTVGHLRREPAGGAWKKARARLHWGDSGVTAWFRGDVRLPAVCGGKRVFLSATTGAPEAMLLVDGQPRGVFDSNHPVVCMCPRGRANQKYHVALEAYAGHTFPGMHPYDSDRVVTKDMRVFESVLVLLERPDVTEFVFDFRTLRQLLKTLDEHSLRRSQVAAGLAEVVAVIDGIPRESDEKFWRPKLLKARAILKPLLARRNGDTTPFFGLMGHSHIDTAWLWTLAETRRKCARTFSSMLNLMEQYREITFLQPAPCHTDMIRADHPSVFREMQKMYRAGRWEPNGAMWVEPDCNIPSGESFARQLLLGAQTTRELFDGYTGDTLWLPDVFGYSAALPQILQLAGVRYFCTTKIAWNDTTRFPYDTFYWKGIDGTSVLAHFNKIHCWPDVESLEESWRKVQHKDVQNRRLMTYGFGDGGGGPQAEMMEMARRVNDLEGCPRTAHTTLTGFMDSLRDDLGPRLPVHSGELYLEGHRGTLTSIAKIKRGNRKCEIALRDAEICCVLAMLHAGGKGKGFRYPAAALSDVWRQLLTNQFHDILPGSSIAAVNDEAIASFDAIGREAGNLASSAMAAIAGGKAAGNYRLLCNTLSWDRSNILLENIPPKTTVDDPQVVTQQVRDVADTPGLAISGVRVPALGTAAVKLKKANGSARSSAFRTGKDFVKTPWAVIRFDKAGHIISLLDTARDREAVQPGGELNSFLLGQDVPHVWDNWDIDIDQRAKLREAGKLRSREVVCDGPLQLRIRSCYELSAASAIVQDMVFHAHSPRIDFDTLIQWNERHKLLKAAFAINVQTDWARHEIQYGHVRRPVHTNTPADRARFEVCCHKWSDLSDEQFGVALLNDSKYGIGMEGNQMRLSLLKSGTHPDERGDAGTHRMIYSILPHGPFSVGNVVREAYELNIPLHAFAANANTAPVASLLTVAPVNVIVEAVKRSEDGQGFIVRLYEAGHSSCTARIQFGTAVKRVQEVNLLEENPRPLKLRGHTLELPLRPFEIKTLKCT